jgi:hypothetical protein
VQSYQEVSSGLTKFDHGFLLSRQFFQKPVGEGKSSLCRILSSNKLALVCECMEGKVTRPGEWCGMHNPATGVFIVSHWCPSVEIGKTWVMGNPCHLTRANSIDDRG